MSFPPNIPNFLIGHKPDFTTILPHNRPDKPLNLNVTPQALTQSLPPGSTQSILSPSTQSTGPTTASVNDLSVQVLRAQIDSLGPFSEGWGNSESPALANRSFSATPTSEIKIDLFYYDKHVNYTSNITSFFSTEFFQSLLINKCFSLQKNKQGVFFLEWNDKTNFQRYLDGRPDIHKTAILIEFIRSMSNERLSNKNINDGLNRSAKSAIIEANRCFYIQQDRCEVNDNLVREAFFLFKSFEFIWLTYNFHLAPIGCDKEHFFGAFHKDKIEMNSKVFKGMIVEWDSEQKRFQAAEYLVEFMGPFLVKITQKSPDVHYFKSVSEIPSDRLILPSLSFLNSRDTFKFLFNGGNILGILNSLNSKDFINSIDNYLRSGKEGLVSSLSTSDWDTNNRLLLNKNSHSSSSSEVPVRDFARTTVIPSIELSSSLIERTHETELSSETYLKLVEFLKAEIWDKKKTQGFF